MSEFTELKIGSEVPVIGGVYGELDNLDRWEGAEFTAGGSRQLSYPQGQTLSWPSYRVSMGPYTGGLDATLGMGGSPGTSIRSAISSGSKNERLATRPPSARPLTRRAPRWPPPATSSPIQLARSIARYCALSMPSSAPRTTCRWARSS